VGKDKLRRFAAIKDFGNVYEPVMNQPSDLRGNWRTQVFKNDHPIVLELGCGKGEYSVGLAKLYPNKNFIGVDLKGNRIYIGAKEALELNLENVVFLRTRIFLFKTKSMKFG
jgi:tRNA (guanine-N7-)-methyltransferase